MIYNPKVWVVVGLLHLMTMPVPTTYLDFFLLFFSGAIFGAGCVRLIGNKNHD